LAIRIISSEEVEKKLIEAIGHITYNPDPAIQQSLQQTCDKEVNTLTQDVLNSIVTNIDLSRQNSIPLCQDTGSLVVFAELGNELVIKGKPLEQIINIAFAKATKKFYLRASTVVDPLFNRTNIERNCPAIVHIRIVTGSRLLLKIAQKGGGAENMSRLKMFYPGSCPQEIIGFVVETVKLAGAKACPPLIIGIGMGGNFEKCAILAKEALLKPLFESNIESCYAEMEAAILNAVNETKIGAQGMGGSLTALAVHIQVAPCHIASLPVAVNLQCHAHRHIEVII
jgi:fumarate hydratase subunit alpha